MGNLSGRQLLALWAILTAGLVLRVLGLGWGLPPSDTDTAESGYRSSYALDEDNTLFALARTNPDALDLDPELYVWGALHLELTLLALEGAEAAGLFDDSWRNAFLEMQPGGFEQVYVIGRLTTTLVDLATVFLCFLLGSTLAGPRAGLWAAAVAALSPGHILQACQIRVDPTAAMLAAATALAVIRRAPPAGIGILGGLACAAKYSTVLQIATLCWFAVRNRRDALRLFGGAVLGFLIGMPFVLSNPAAVWAQVGHLFSDQFGGLAAAPSRLDVLAGSVADFFRFGVGIPAGLLAVKGLWDWSRSGGTERALAAACLAGFVAALVPTWPFLRYQTPFLPLAAVATGCALTHLGRLRVWAGAAALIIAGLTSVRLVEARLAPHPANLALSVLRMAAKPGQSISRLMPELPPLDPGVYPLGPNPLLDDLRTDPPAWVLINSLAAIPYPQANLDLLEGEYDRVAVFRTRPLWLWTTLGEAHAPLDWRYLRPEITLYRRQ